VVEHFALSDELQNVQLLRFRRRLREPLLQHLREPLRLLLLLRPNYAKSLTHTRLSGSFIYLFRTGR
jgi:hypothetical protein